MAVNLVVETTVKTAAVDEHGKPVPDDNGNPTTTGDPLYDSFLLITADTGCPITISIPKSKSFVVSIEAGTATWLKFFGISPKPPKGVALPKPFTFYCTDDKYCTKPFDLSGGAVAYWADSLTPLFTPKTGDDELGELKKVVFTNSGPCPIDVTIYVVRNVADPQTPADPCPAGQ